MKKFTSESSITKYLNEFLYKIIYLVFFGKKFAEKNQLKKTIKNALYAFRKNNTHGRISKHAL